MLEKGVLPGDLHAGNIMIDSSKNVRFIDLDDYSFVGAKNVLVSETIIDIASICKSINPDFNCSAIKGLITNECIAQGGRQELTEKVVGTILAAVNAELQKLG